jgi:hypothetical protein
LEGLSLRRELHGFCAVAAQHFPSFLEGLSLRLGAFTAEALSEQFLRFLAEAFIEAE